ncbi:MAG: type I DNA topoisomerase [Bacteroidia bacterium]|nr:type I DNA topoisomerase [Bacteroidia bacterium]MBP7260498.1 type I DNA topoisomerase [Bacteroidia bacterium]MBP9179559.1 type I DNA topoisomerase [Bacteroidia bacterium]MBP9724037.1 type I DNA topoisomerase [Bacteroidia bacterium]
MAKNLVIVESPAKAKTIEKFLGKDFTVKSCYGHIRDLAKGDSAIDIKNNFLPSYEVDPEKKQLVKELKKLADDSDLIWLASDEDREGEAISWHLSQVLELKESKTRRIVFHEITKPAILKAIDNPRSIDMHLVNAQQARRVLDRLVGFEISPILWKKVKPSLSAGRVQSVAVRLIVEREREIQNFNTVFSYKVTAEFLLTDGSGKKLKAELPKRFNNFEDARILLEKCKGAVYNIKNLETKPGKKSPAPPFTTSTLQQEASRKLGFSVSQTMTIAQKLYEAGLITYMRTDSVNLSELAIDASRKEIQSHYGPDFAQTRRYTTKSSGAQEAHEAIRPTYFENHTIDGDSGAKRLYDLIWKRTVASQMADAQLEKTVATISISTTSEEFVATGEVLKFEGFLKAYMESKDDDNADEESAGMLPPLKVGDKLNLEEMTAIQKFSRPAPRYTEASLVKKLEELGIGRPSTYAPTISTIQKRGYVVKEDREGKERTFQQLTLKKETITEEVKTEVYGSEKSKLFPSDIGSVVNDFLVKHFDAIMDYHFTAKVEKEFDEIAQGQLQWNRMIEEFYGPFHSIVEKTTETAEKQTGERLLGKHPESGKNVYVKIGRYGPLAQIGENATEDEKPQYAGLRGTQTIETISLEEAIDLFKLPRIAGQFEDKDIKVSIGKFGPYLLHDNKFVSLPKTDDPYEVNEQRAIELIEAKRKSDAEKLIATYNSGEHTIQLLNGRWGPYISVGKQNFKIPKGTEAKNLTLEECMELIQKQGGIKEEKKAVKAAAKKTAPKKSAVKKATAKKSPAKKTATKKAAAKTTKK